MNYILELIGLSNRVAEFRKLSTQILAVSIDSPFSHFHCLLSRQYEGGLFGLLTTGLIKRGFFIKVSFWEFF